MNSSTRSIPSKKAAATPRKTTIPMTLTIPMPTLSMATPNKPKIITTNALAIQKHMKYYQTKTARNITYKSSLKRRLKHTKRKTVS